MKFNQHVLAAFVALFVLSIAVPLPSEAILDAPAQAIVYKTEVNQQAAAKRTAIIIDTPDNKKPYKTEIDQQAAEKRA
ncbi:hypothetical protein GGS24DRAFT_506544 [Hypoxylon argillaceum]|nr:hypothetical protein GGS24DRAFT_506544 [Hypoxylon argillaceum]